MGSDLRDNSLLEKITMINNRYPNMNKEIDDEKCQSIILNLLKMNDEAAIVSPSSYIRLWQQTLRCSGSIKDTCKKRLDDYERYINDCDSAAFSKIIQYKCEENDKDLAGEVTSHYRRDDRRVLLSNLTWGSYFKYHFYEKSGKTTEVITITTFIFGTISGFIGNRIGRFLFKQKSYSKRKFRSK